MIFGKVEQAWIDNALAAIRSGELSEMQVAKTLRTIGQIFNRKAQDIEFNLIDKVENRLYNTNTQTEKETTNA